MTERSFVRMGEMGRRISGMDWSTTPLGPLADWPQSLKTAVSIMLTSRYPMFVWWGEELIHLYNDGYIPILGARHPTALGRPAHQVWHEIWEQVGPQAELALRQGESTWQEQTLLLMQRNDYVEETYFTYSYSPLRDDHGVLSGVFCASLEETQRVLHERRLHVLRRVSEVSVEAGTEKDAAKHIGRILGDADRDVSFALLYLADEADRGYRLAAATHGGLPAAYAPERIPFSGSGEGAWDFAPAQGGDASRVALPADAGLPGGAWPEPATSAVVLPLSSGTGGRPAGVLVAGLSPRRVFDENYGRFFDLLASGAAGALSSTREFEAERRRSEALAELDRAKTTFFSNVSHEFRTPLTLMLAPLEDAADGGLRLDERDVGQIRRNGERMLKLVNTMLDFARVEAGRSDVHFRPTDLASATKDLASAFRSTIEAAGLRYEVRCEALDAPVHVDREMYEKIVLNLLSNAFKHTFEGEIEVTLTAEDDAALLTVRDTGGGIPPEDLPHVFDRFYRVRGVRARSLEGTGIGLALVRELVRLHGGSIDVESRASGGSRFIVRLPFGVDHLPADRIAAADEGWIAGAAARPFVSEALRWSRNEPVPAGEADAEVGAGAAALAVRSLPEGDRPRLLIADDNADMRDYLGRLFVASGYDVTTVSDGREALAEVERNRPDLLLSDVMMAGLDGMALLARIRETPATASLPVVLLSARAGEEARLEGLEAGASDYVVKPFSARELVVRVNGLIELARVRAESARREREIRDEAAQVMRELEGRFRQMADSAPTMIWVTNPEGETVFLSRSWYDFTGQPATEILDEELVRAVHPDDREAIRAAFAAANRRREPFRGEYRLRRNDGAHRWVIAAATPYIDDAGDFHGYVGSVIDITERREVERALREADSRKDRFLATLAHELRNPLAPLSHGLELLRHGLDPATGEKIMASMDRQLENIVRLVDDLLDVGRVSLGKIELQTSRLELADVLRMAVETSRPAIDERGHEFVLEPPSKPVPVIGDRTRLEQVFANLLQNAARYTDPGGHIRMEARIDDHHVRVAVEDDGIGIAPEMRERIFELFAQGKSGHGPAGGLGIGLTLVRQLVDLHGGSIEVESAGLGTGSRFTVTLPLAPAELAPSRGEGNGGAVAVLENGAAVPAESVGRRVLVVDDNQSAGEMLTLLLESLGHDTVVAVDGFEALEVGASFDPDIVFLDIGLPGMNGYETCRHMREREWGRRARIVAVTGWGQEEDKRLSREAGFDFHLVKPVRREVLVGMLD